MSTLETATAYSVLIYTSLMIIFLIFGIILVLAVKSKVNKAKKNVKEKLNIATNIPYIVQEVIKAIKSSKWHDSICRQG